MLAYLGIMTTLAGALAAAAINVTSVTEGVLDFTIPSTSQTAQTWYKIIGHLKPDSRPLIALHGGPGIYSGYLEILCDITEKANEPLVLYDMVGNGRSTHYPEEMGNTSFWTEDLFLAELDNVLDQLKITKYDILGHSWGGMLGARHATLRPPGLNKIVLMSTPASIPLYLEGIQGLRAALPDEIREALDKHESDGTTDDPEYQNAVGYFYSLHLCTIEPFPEAIAEGFAWIAKDPTVYVTMFGPNEFFATGSLKNWTVVDDISKIAVPTLLTNGGQDEVTDLAVAPFVENLGSDQLKRVKFQKSAHMAHYEERERFTEVVFEFLYQ